MSPALVDTPDPTNNACFFYGTLMSPKVLSRVIYGTTTPEPWQSAALNIVPAVLHNYCRRQVRFADYPGIIPQDGKAVKGTYVTGLTQGDLWRLDLFEGREYVRSMLPVKLDGEREVVAATYVWGVGEDRLEEEEWDFETFVREKLWRWVGDSKEFDEVDQADPLGGRWWQNGFKEQQEVEEGELKSAV